MMDWTEDNDGWEDLPPQATNNEPQYEAQNTTTTIVPKRRDSQPQQQPRQRNEQRNLPPTRSIASNTTSTTRTERPNKPTTPFPLDQNKLLIKFALRFGIILIRDVWRVDVWMRFAGLCLLVGIVCRTLLWSLFCFLYPKQVMIVTTMVVGLAVPLSMVYGPKLQRVWKEIRNGCHPGDVLIDVLGRSMNSTELRILYAFVFYILPVVLEMRTLQFLTDTVSVSYTVAIFFLGVVALYYSHQGQLYRADNRLLSAKECHKHCLYILYGCALATVAMGKHPRKHIPSLAAPFFLATSLILYELSQYDISDVVRNALRQTLRETLQEIGSTIQQDQLLQLTMLRWIADYWASSSSGPSATSTTATTQAATSSAPANTTTSSTSNNTSSASASSRPSRPGPQRHGQLGEKELEWSELWTMLQATTNQMTTEVQSLQHADTSSSIQNAAQSSNAYTTTNTRPSDSSPPSPVDTGPSNVRPPRQTSETHATTTNQSISSHRHDSDDDVMQGLRAMLTSMDIDERAKPAVLAYKNMIDTLPPSSRTALALGLLRRCPASTLLLFYLFVGIVRLYIPSVVAMVLLVPFAFFESNQVRLWLNVCQELSQGKDEGQTINPTTNLEELDSMTLLLINENVYQVKRSSTLLAVWSNIQASVSALEMGLTAARCAQTTVVAMDFGANILSLVNFGLEVSEHGWFHGASIVARELMHLQTTGTDINSLTHGANSPDGATYTSAAMGAIRNSQRMGRNLSALSQEGTASHVIAPLLSVVPLLVGQGWLWGQERNAAAAFSEPSEPAVTIEELGDDKSGDRSLHTQENHTSLDSPVTSISSATGLQHESDLDLLETTSFDDADTKGFVPLAAQTIPAESSRIDALGSEAVSLVSERKESPSVTTEPSILPIDSRSADDTAVLEEPLKPVTEKKCTETSGASSANTVANQCFNDEEDELFEPLENGVNLDLGDVYTGALSVDSDDDMKNRLSLPASSPVEANSQVRGQAEATAKENEGDNLWLKVGLGSAAVISAVAGIAIAANQNNDDKEKRRRNCDNS